MHRTRIAALGTALLLAALSLTACGGDGSTPDDSSGSSAGTTIDITITSNSVDPSGDRVEAKVGEPITLKIDAAEAGELHVHSSPEQEIAFPAGTSTKTLTIDKPGIIEVEDHDLEKVIVQLQVS